MEGSVRARVYYDGATIIREVSPVDGCVEIPVPANIDPLGIRTSSGNWVIRRGPRGEDNSNAVISVTDVDSDKVTVTYNIPDSHWQPMYRVEGDSFKAYACVTNSTEDEWCSATFVCRSIGTPMAPILEEDPMTGLLRASAVEGPADGETAKEYLCIDPVAPRTTVLLNLDQHALDSRPVLRCIPARFRYGLITVDVPNEYAPFRGRVGAVMPDGTVAMTDLVPGRRFSRVTISSDTSVTCHRSVKRKNSDIGVIVIVTIDVANRHGISREIVVQERIPSGDRGRRVEVVECGGAEVSDSVVTWKLNLPAGDQRTLALEYEEVEIRLE